tara:strand:+ start:1010 stop:2296 length:1287 start_codon:yes stop_codon:yes gene_type:complete
MTAYEFSENIQRGIVYLSKSSRSFLTQVMPMVKSGYFEYPTHQKMYNVVIDYYVKYKSLPTDDVILEELKRIKSSTELLSDYKEELFAINEFDETSLAKEEYYLEKVEEFAQAQSLKDAICKSVTLLDQKDYSAISEEIRNALSVGRNVDLGLNYFEDVQGRWGRLSEEGGSKDFRTPFESLNEALDGGLASKELSMVVAPPGVGKSLFLANQAARSVIDGKNVVYVSLEMSEDRIAQRLDSIFTRFRQEELGSNVGEVESRLKVIQQQGSKVGKLRIKEFPTKRLTVAGLRAYLNQLRNYHDFVPDVVVIDYLELLLADASMPEYQAQERTAQELRGFATEYDCLVWTATQTNREGKKVDVITDAELADSYGKIRVCDLVFSINQSEAEFDRGEARLFIMKSRNGKARFIIPISIDYTRLVIAQRKG